MPFQTGGGNIAKLAYDESQEAKQSASTAITSANEANAKSDFTQKQLDQVAGASTIDPAVEQMKVDTEGTTHASPDARLRSDYNKVTSQLAQKAKKEEVRLRTIKIEPEDASERLLELVTGEGTINLLSVPQEKSVTPDKTTFLRKGKNIINKNDFEVGKTLSSLGDITANSDWSLSPFIWIEPNTDYVQNNGYVICFYDIDKNFISGLNSDGAGSQRKITTPENAMYIRTAIDNRWLDEYQIEKGKASTHFEKYKEKMTSLEISENNLDSYLTRRIVDPITETRTTFIEIGKNLLNVDNFINGIGLHSSGLVQEVENYSTSEYIHVSPNENYTQNQSFVIIFYDELKNVIDGIGQSSPSRDSRTFTTPSNCVYIRTSILTDRLHEYQIEKGAESTEYEKFKRTIPHLDNENISNLIQRIEKVEAEKGDTVIADKRAPYPPTISVEKIEDTDIPLWVTKEGNVYGAYSNYLLYSEDDWQTKTTLTSVGGDPGVFGAIGAVRDLNNGELLVCTNMWVSGQEKAKAFISEGFSENPETATWSMVQEASTMNARFRNDWGTNVYENIILLSEYGDRGQAGKAYLSQDYGKNFKEIFNFNELAGDPANCHIHASCYDPYRNMLWITTGDGVVPTNAITAFSLDMGENWTILHGLPQQVTVFPMPDCILFLSDDISTTNAVYRLPIKNKYDIKGSDLELAHQMDDSQYLTFVGTMAFKNYHNPNQPTYFAWNRAGGSAPAGYGKIMATFDGYKFYEIYEDDVLVHGNGSGVNSVFGPTKNGKIIGTVSYPNEPTQYFIADAPQWV